MPDTGARLFDPKARNRPGALWRTAQEGGGDLFREFAHYAGPRALIGAVALIAAGALLEGMGILLLVPVLGVLVESWAQGGPAGPLAAGPLSLLQEYEPMGRMLILLALFALLIVVRGVVLTARDSHLARLQHGFVESIRLRLIGRIAASPWQSVARLKNARVVHALSSDMLQIGIAAHFGLQCAIAMAMLVANGVLAIALAPMMSMIAISLLLLLALASGPHLRRARALGRTVLTQNLLMTDGSIRLLDGLKIAAAQNLQDRFVDEYEAASNAALSHRVDFIRLEAGFRNFSTAMVALGGALMVLIGIAVIDLHPTVLIALILLLSRMNAPALLMQKGAQQIMYGLPAYRAVRAIEAELPTTATEAGNGPGPMEAGLRCALTLSEVSFVHRAGDAETAGGIDRISVSLPAGAVVGITGPSGSGKTTFVDLVAGIFVPQSGGIAVNGASLDGANLHFHRSRLAYVGQDPVLFGDTIRRNLLWAAPTASEAAMWQAIELVGAGDIVRRLGHGLDSPVGERGGLISTGERQRIALARAFLRRPRLFILDEATSSIDVPGERIILQRLCALKPRPTILMVSHRAESLALCDRILGFSAGQLVQDTKIPGRSEPTVNRIPPCRDPACGFVAQG